ncbi:MAG: lysine 2,3-aminomutase, partial [Myxococcales bacterium]|nr:lysine 2,3-aminomutase [Myxococcales bacterium]
MTTRSSLSVVDDSPDDGEAGPEDWRWQLRHAVRDVAGLRQHLRLTPAEEEGLARATSAGLPLQLTPYYLGLLAPDDPTCPIRRQVVPVAAEAVT